MGENRDSDEKCLLKTVSSGGEQQQMREVKRPFDHPQFLGQIAQKLAGQGSLLEEI